MTRGTYEGPMAVVMMCSGAQYLTQMLPFDAYSVSIELMHIPRQGTPPLPPHLCVGGSVLQAVKM